MKTAKLVTGILCMVFTMLVLFQSCAAGIADTLGDTGGVSGMGGFLVGLLMLSGGIVEVATRKSEKNGGAIAAVIIFGLAAVVGFATAGIFADLNIWAAWCLILAALNLLSIFVGKKKDEKKENLE